MMAWKEDMEALMGEVDNDDSPCPCGCEDPDDLPPPVKWERYRLVPGWEGVGIVCETCSQEITHGKEDQWMATLVTEITIHERKNHP